MTSKSLFPLRVCVRYPSMCVEMSSKACTLLRVGFSIKGNAIVVSCGRDSDNDVDTDLELFKRAAIEQYFFTGTEVGLC